MFSNNILKGIFEISKSLLNIERNLTKTPGSISQGSQILRIELLIAGLGDADSATTITISVYSPARLIRHCDVF